MARPAAALRPVRVNPAVTIAAGQRVTVTCTGMFHGSGPAI